MSYEVRPVVCDYGIYDNNELILIINSRLNALLIRDILTEDDKHKVFNINK